MLKKLNLKSLLLTLIIGLIIGIYISQNLQAAVPETVKFYGSPQSPIASGVVVPGGKAYYWSSGIVPPLLNENAPKGSRERFGDTKTQAINILKRIETQLKKVDLSLADVIYLRVYLVPDAMKDNQVDYQGWFEAYSQFFNNETNPNKVARSTVGVSSLVSPEWLIEIEAVAVFR